MNKLQRKHGGKRIGSGRKPIYTTPMIVRQIAMPIEYWNYAKQLGDGNVSAGVRAIVDDHLPDLDE